MSWSSSPSAVIAQGSAPTLPAAGTAFLDPIFDTEIMRVTDQNTQSSAQFGTAYSYWATFNCDNTKILAVTGASARIFDFDPVNFMLGSSIAAPAGVISYEHGVYWSRTNPNYLFGVSGLAIKRLDVSAGSPSWTTLRTYTAGSLGSGAAGFIQIHLSDDDSVLSATVTNISDTKIGIAAVNTGSTNVLYYEATTDVDEAQIDKSGVYLCHKTGLAGAGQIEVRIINVDTDVAVELTDDSPDYAPGHSDNGDTTVYGYDNWGNTITKRNLATPHSFSTIFSPSNWNAVGHISTRMNSEDWILVSSYAAVLSEVFNNEIFFVKTDGSGEVRRFVKHYSDTAYEQLPKANVSMDGKFVAYTSTYKTARTDLFIAKVPSDMGVWTPPVQSGRTARRLLFR